MSKAKPDPKYRILALDPGGRVAGVALSFLTHPGQVYEEIFDMDLDRCQVIADTAALMATDGSCLLVVSEYPTAGTPNGPQVRQAANIIITRLKKMFPRRVKVVKVVPQTWQSMVTKGLSGKTAKDRSVARASLDYKIEASYLAKHTDIADALNILTYARGFVRWSDGK